MSNLGRFRPSPAMIVAVIALVVALTGTGVAAIVVTGANIKNGSVTGLDIKNGSVSGLDIKNGSVSGLDIKDGSVGSADVTNGSLGVIDLSAATIATLGGSSTAAYHVDSGGDTLLWNNLNQPVVSLNLPAGNYVLFGKVRAENNSTLTPADVNCTLALGGGLVDAAATVTLAEGTPVGDREYLPLSGRGNLATAGAATITCTSTSNVGDYVDRAIEAIRVGSLP